MAASHGEDVRRDPSDNPPDDLPAKLSAPARRALETAGLTRLAQLAEGSEAEVARLHGIDPNALRQLRAALDSRGLAFRS